MIDPGGYRARPADLHQVTRGQIICVPPPATLRARRP